MSAEDIIRQHRDSPLIDSINAVARSLASRPVFVGTEDVAPTEGGKLTGTLRLKTAADKYGRLWIYAYTSREEFLAAFPQGGPFAEMSFSTVFGIAEGDHRFAGISLNSASDLMYPIPRELFKRVRQILGKKADG